MIRPELRTALWRAREVLGAAALGALGLWFTLLGGWLLIPLGLVLALSALGFGVVAWRRMRFVAEGYGGPGLVEVIEGEVRYLGPLFGGMVAIADIRELALLRIRGQRLWRISTAGEALLIPVEAEGAAALFDVFDTLPGLKMPELLALLERETLPSRGLVPFGGAETCVIWRAPPRPVLT